MSPVTAGTMVPCDWYEAFAERFSRCRHHMMAPGKDEPASYSSGYSREERRGAWEAFLALLGPGDMAMILSLWLMRAEQERRDQDES